MRKSWDWTRPVSITGRATGKVDVLFRDNRAELERFIRTLREEHGRAASKAS